MSNRRTDLKNRTEKDARFNELLLLFEKIMEFCSAIATAFLGIILNVFLIKVEVT